MRELQLPSLWRLEAGDIKSQSSIFKASVLEATAVSCGPKEPQEVVTFEHRGGKGSHPTEEEGLMGDVVPGKSGASCKVLMGSSLSHEGVVWEFRRTTEKDFQMAPRCFWKTI